MYRRSEPPEGGCDDRAAYLYRHHDSLRERARPHIGFALELVQADVLARYRRGRGDAVRFQAGTDDNSLKNVIAAEAAGVGP